MVRLRQQPRVLLAVVPILFLIVRHSGAEGADVFAPPPPSPTSSNTTSLRISSVCLARLFIGLQGTSQPMSNTVMNNVTQSVLSCVLGLGDSATPTSYRALRVVFPSVFSSIVDRALPALAAVAGWQVEAFYWPFEETAARIRAMVASVGTGYYDAFDVESAMTMELANANVLENMDAYVASAPKLNWTDFFSILRNSSAAFNGSVVGVPISGSLQHMHYQRDVLARAGLGPPDTWQQLVEVAKALNGTDMDGDGQGDWALCLQLAPSTLRDPSVFLSQVLASITQTQGTSTGWLFDPNTMNTFVDSPAMLHALEVVSQILPYNNFTDTSEQKDNAFVQQRCAIQFGASSSFKATQLVGKLGGRIGTTALPGSTVVLNRATGELSTCTLSLCPYAKTLKDGGLVNRAPFSGYSTIINTVNKNSPAVMKATSYSIVELTTGGEFSMQYIRSLTPFGPSRYQHLCVTSTCLALWERSGFNATDVAQYLNAVRVTADAANFASDLRMLFATEYRDALSQALNMLLNGTNASTVQAVTSQRFAAINAKTTLQQLGDAYLAGLNLRRRFAVPSPPTPPPAAGSAESVPPSGGSSGLSTGGTIGVTVGAIVGFALLTGLATAFVMSRRNQRRRGLFGRAKAPGPGPETTLVVTDVEGSTSLWENLPLEVMNSVMELHHKLVRKLLAQHYGHESDTEGDSFIVAFSSPWDALGFAQALQAGLLLLEWPLELLNCPSGRPVWVQRGELDATDLWGSHDSRLPSALSPSGITSKLRQLSMFPASGPPRSPSGVHVRESLAGNSHSRLSGLRNNRAHSGGGEMISSGLTVTPTMPSMTAVRESPLGRPSMPGSPRGAAEDEEGDNNILCTLQRGWVECPPPGMASNRTLEAQEVLLAHRGLRVRVGVHSGLGADDLVAASQNKNTKYGGLALATAKAMCDCGHGGMVLLSEACRSVLVPATRLAAFSSIVHMGDYQFSTPGAEGGPVYLAVSPELQHQLPLLLDHPLRSVSQQHPGVVQAPATHAAVVFVNVVGGAALTAWDAAAASRAFALMHHHAIRLMSPTGEPDGYAVKLADGLGVCAFSCAFAATLWAVHLVDDLRLSDEWEPALLAHELCEEVVVDGAALAQAVSNRQTPNSHGRAQREARKSILSLPEGPTLDAPPVQPRSRRRLSVMIQPGVPLPAIASNVTNREEHVLFRGLRLKVGVDTGPVQAAITPGTGRVDYRGRVMNRASRIAAKSHAGQVWASRPAWEAAQRRDEHTMLDARPLGAMALKGVNDPVELVQCILINV